MSTRDFKRQVVDVIQVSFKQSSFFQRFNNTTVILTDKILNEEFT